MADPRRYPFCYFQPYNDNDQPIDGIFCAVEFDAGFKLSSGMKPDVNHARVSPIELQKLGPNPGVTGALFWYGNNDPEADEDGSGADVVMTFISIVDVQPEELGESPQLGYGVQVLVWRVFFADWRDGLQFPRGGRLNLGLMNQSPVASSVTADHAMSGDKTLYEDLYQNSELLTMCFKAMNIDDWATAPDDADNIDPVTNLQWHGTHAPTALADLMSKVGATFCPHLDGTASVEVIGEGDQPQPDASDVIAWLNIPAIDRRGKVAILTSAPAPKKQTQWIGGPTGDTWQFVIQDTNDVWFNIAEGSDWADFREQCGFDDNIRPIDVLNIFEKLAASSDATADFGKVQNRVREQLYRCVRLSPDQYPPDKTPILRFVFEADGSTTYISCQAIIAQQVAPGIYRDSADPMDLPCAQCVEGCMLQFHDLLVKTNDGSDPDNTGQFMELYGGDPEGDGSDADLQIRVTQEMVIQDTDDAGNTIYKPDYYEIGFTGDGQGNPQKMSDGDVQNALDKPDRNTTLHWRPEWTNSLVWNVDGTDTDHSTIDSAAAAEAKNLLQNLSQPSQELHIRGFFDCDLNGIISEIQWLQKEYKTVIKINQYYRGGSEQLQSLLGVSQ
jgi:hypothetical protein